MFADKNNPIRCSKLAALVKCSMRVYMLFSTSDEDELGSAAAQVGSLTHAGVAAFHTTKGSLTLRKGAALDAIKHAAPNFPRSRHK